MPAPAKPKIYHIVHVDRLAAIIADGGLWCDRDVVQCNRPGTPIGMADIKRRRLHNPLNSRPGLHVGDCAPFYFCPRSVMLYMIYMANHSRLTYRGGQNPIIHLEADLRRTVAWAEIHNQRWAFTLSNAGAHYFGGSLRPGATGQDRLGRGPGDGLARLQGRQAGGIPDRTAVPLGIGLAYRRAIAKNSSRCPGRPRKGRA